MGFKIIGVHADTVSSILKNYGTYTIATLGDNKLLEVSGEVKQGDKLKDDAKLVATNHAVQLERWQKWQISKQPNGYYTIMNLNSGKYIGVLKDTLCQYRLSGDKAQYWKIVVAGKGGYKIINDSNGQVITFHDGKVILENNTNSTDQHWLLNAIKSR